MPWQLSGRDENRVESNLMIFIGRICGEKMVGRACNPHFLAFVDCVGRGCQVTAGLDLNRDKQPRAACDDVDLADGAAVAASQQPKSLQAQQKSCPALGAMTASLGGLAVRCCAQLSGSSPVISSARR